MRPAATTAAVAWARGRIAALTSAETVRSSRPSRLVSSWPAQAGRPRSRATSRTSCSPVGSSTAKASLTATDPAPAATRSSTTASAWARVRPSEPSTNRYSGRRTRPGARARWPMFVRLRAGPEVRLLADADQPDRREVALEQRVDREGRRVADHEDRAEVHLPDGSRGLAQDRDDPLGDAVRGGVAGRDDGAGHDLARRDVDGGGLGERPTDVDPETDGHVRPRRAGRRSVPPQPRSGQRSRHAAAARPARPRPRPRRRPG